MQTGAGHNQQKKHVSNPKGLAMFVSGLAPSRSLGPQLIKNKIIGRMSRILTHASRDSLVLGGPGVRGGGSEWARSPKAVTSDFREIENLTRSKKSSGLIGHNKTKKF